MALTQLADTLEIGLARIPFRLTPIEAEKFQADLHILAEMLEKDSVSHTTLDAVDLNKLVTNLGQTSELLSRLDHSDAFTALTAIRDAKRSLEH